MSRMKRLFTAWRGGSAERGAMPPPDSTQPVRVDRSGEKLVEVLTSAGGHRRVGITRDGPGIYRLRVENDRGTEVTPELVVAWRLPPELEFVSGRSNKGGVTVTGAGQACQSSAFALGLDEAADFDITVRVLSAPANGLVRTDASVTAPALGGAELANESESTSLRP